MRILISISSNLLRDYQEQFSDLKREASTLITLVGKNNSYWHMYRSRIYQIQDGIQRIQTVAYQTYKRGGHSSREFHQFHEAVHTFAQNLRKVLERIKSKEHLIKPVPNLAQGKNVENPAPPPTWMPRKLTGGRAGSFTHEGEAYVWNIVDGVRNVIEVAKKIPSATTYYQIA